ncbi:SpvB/TcaC N-terminal domain-containing protein [Aeromicrobium sp.]|uniref:SpvB/TcaC N-terminal domain-containing protein n=1 Tax=Aeromicrobium sp. TaxID=1871063 RepID=UPI00198F3ACD|nr:SpvB/TcaC N-terminal domain-containing protein [Aeromicrobium sp.]MBC7632955.1 toxin [Aeromicrobium sp.]
MRSEDVKDSSADRGRPAPSGQESSSSASPTIQLPKGGGAIRGIGEKFAANPVTGTGSFTVPLAVSPGRSGFGPQLSLSYDSGAGNGPFGFGWSLGLPQITRRTDKGLPTYQDDADADVFVLSGAEDLVPVLQADGTQRDDDVTAPGYSVRRYRPRIEGLFARIERWTHHADGEVHWRSISRDNVLSLYGLTEQARIADPEQPGRVFSWLICETRDDRGNVVLYDYRREDGGDVDMKLAHERHRGKGNDPRRTANRYPEHIRYGNQTPLLDAEGRRPRFLSDLPRAQLDDVKWLFEVVFDYHAEAADVPTPDDARPWSRRADAFSSYRSGFEVRTTRLCQRVLMFHHFEKEEGVRKDCLVRSTDFSYTSRNAPPSGTANYTFLLGVTHSSYRREGAGYRKQSLPPVEFEYSQPIVQDKVEHVNAASLEHLPIGVDGTTYQWTDLHGEGLPGILTEQLGAWFYTRNLSPLHQQTVEFAPQERVALRPNTSLAGGAQFMDLAGDGLPDLVTLDGPLAGLYEHDDAEGWDPFRPFASRLNVDFRDPNLKLVDLDGDGHADVLITGDDALIWHPSLGEDGFGPARRVALSRDEAQGPRLVFANDAGSVFMADLSGDGLSDLVRIHNGEICYWPNLGYGRFGARVTMDGSPWFDHPEQFDPRRLRLADIDGSGTTDLIYLHRDGVRLYFNQSGNSWSEPQSLKVFPRVNDLASIVPTDLLGNGTVCLVWSSSLPGDASRPMRYVNLMGERKPHLLVGMTNNLGAETRVQYAPSTKFYLQDKRAGHPWITRLPFPVHVVERVETTDHLSRNRFVSRSAYHHGYFDGDDREFRGFGMVEQWDTEEFGALTRDGNLPAATKRDPAAINWDPASHVPPVRTRTWFHTGAALNGGRISHLYAHEYFGAPDTRHTADDPEMKVFEATLVPDTVLPEGLTLAEAREACRALKGSMLRQEVYADDAPSGAPEPARKRAAIPYTVTEQNFTVRLVQPQYGNRHAVVFTHPREAVSSHLERRPDDPRVQHALTLEVDRYGNVQRQAAIGYGRRQPDAALPTDADRDAQTALLITYTENRVTNAIDDVLTHPDTYRTPLACESCTYELTGVHPTDPSRRFTFGDWTRDGFALLNQAALIDYERSADPGVKQKRLIEQVRTLYRADDLGALLLLAHLEPLALTGENYKLAFTPGLIDQVFVRDGQALMPDVAAVLGGQGADQGGYVSGRSLKADGRFPAADPGDSWWIPSGRTLLSPTSTHTAVQELAYARKHFFLPCRSQTPFHTGAVSTESVVTFDDYDLLTLETRDALGNTVTVGERRLDGTVDPRTPGHDYRLLQAWRVMDPNRNRSQVAFDTLGMVVGSAVMGKPEEALGDSLEGLNPDLTADQILGHLAQPLSDPLAVLGRASTRLIYDLFAYHNTKATADPQPPVVYTLARETHAVDLENQQQTRVQHAFSYSDGFGREIQKKIQAEPGPLVDGGPVVSPRWVGSGWTVYNNKGQPVRKYEPFFDDTHHFRFGAQVGVSPVLFYDPVGRVGATLHPNHTYEKVVFDPWQQTTFDVNDTCAPRPAPPGDTRPPQTGDPHTDPDIAGYVGEYFKAMGQGVGWQTWHAQRIGGALGPDERNAAVRAEAHADTPITAHFDVLGRPFLTTARNRVVCDGHALDGTEESSSTRVKLDIEGNQRAVLDERQLPLNYLPTGAREQRTVMQYDYDTLGNRIHQLSMEAGARWMLSDVTGKPIRTWDSRGHTFTTAYDALRRPVQQSVRGTTAASDPRTLNRDIWIDRTEYGEPPLNPTEAQEEQAQRLNLRTRIYRHFDSAGIATNARLDADSNPTEAYDFKGNLLHGTRRLIRDYKSVPDWSLPAEPQLDAESFESSTRYDALNRPVQSIAPHSSVIRPQHPDRINVIQPVFNEANLLERVDVWLERPAEPTGLLDPAGEAPSLVGVANVDYDAKGQRQRIDYKNGASTLYSYDPLTFRLTQLVTRRSATSFPDDDPQPAVPNWPGKQVQNLHYTYDPAGNITHIQDDAQQTIFFKNKRVEPSNDYTYDALYRLIQASGREHLGQGGAPVAHSYNDAGRVGIFNADAAGHFAPKDGNAMGTYVESYIYDAVGNFLQMQHRGTDPPHPGWTRAYDFLEPSLIEDGIGTPLKTSNRLTRTTLNPDDANPPPYQHDAHGNMIRMPHLDSAQGAPNMHWDYRDQLRQTDLGGGGTAWYIYDASGQRVRKVWKKMPGLIEERIYLGGFEIFRRHGNAISQNTATLERETLHVMDDKQRIALVETLTIDTAGTDQAPRQLIRYQFSNHLGSASLELDKQAQIISYEEYAPYGSSTYQAVRSQTEMAKRYRYTGKERDEESGLYYHGARYYAPWLGRWTASDPIWQDLAIGSKSAVDHGSDDDPNAKITDRMAPAIVEVNLYAYVEGRPTVSVDLSGLSPVRVEATTAAAWKTAFERKLDVKGRLYDRGGTTKGEEADKMLRKYGESNGFLLSQKPTGKTSWMQRPDDKTPTGESKRYIYTKKGGWIDMVHFLFYAGRARDNLDKYRDELDTQANRAKIFVMNRFGPHVDFKTWRDESARDLALQATVQEGRIQEYMDDESKGQQKLSAYSYEDLPSDKFGADFAINFFDPKSDKTLADQLDAYLQKLNATGPDEAPNWANVTEANVPNHPIQNFTTTPMYTEP